MPHSSILSYSFISSGFLHFMCSNSTFKFVLSLLFSMSNFNSGNIRVMFYAYHIFHLYLFLFFSL